MKNNYNDELLSEDYTLKRLAYINSANNAYSEIMLDSHIAMFGDNNAGKTASLAGTKLLLFPETDFYNCKEKFRFKGKTGLFSMEQSYDFYFPDPRSFIVLEVVNPEGTFCMVLHKKTNYGYGRSFVPVEYDQLRQVFWNKEDETFSTDLGVSALTKFVKDHDGLQLNDERDIAELMFASHRQTKDRKRFCVLPFKDARKESIDVFRNIYHLAFETGEAETNSLPTAIATLLEMSRSREQERLDLNLRQLGDEYEQLLEKSEWLQRLANAKPTFDLSIETYDAFKDDHLTYSNSHSALQQTYDKAKQDYDLVLQQLESEHREANDTAESKKSELKTASKELDRIRTTVNNIAKTKEKKGKKLEQDTILRRSYTDKTILEILEWLDKDKNDLEQNIQQYRTDGGIQRLLEKNNQKRNALIQNIKGLTTLISNVESGVLHQLKDLSASSVLYSINPEFANIAAKLDLSVRDTMLAFTDLFGQDGSGQMTFLDNTVGDIAYKSFDPEQQLEQQKVRLKTYQNDLSDLDIEIREQKEAISNQNYDLLIESAEKDIREIDKDIAAIGGLEQLKNELAELEQEHKEMSAQLETEERAFKESESLYESLKGKASKAFYFLEDHKKKGNDFDTIGRFINLAKEQIKPVNVEVEILDKELMTPEAAIELFDQAKKLNNQFKQFEDHINDLIRALPRDNVDPHKATTSLPEYDTIVECYRHEFANLSEEQTQLKLAIRSHNELLNHQLNELKEAKNLLTSFINGINQELNDKHISNLKEIKLHHELNPSFLHLLNILAQHDMQDESLLESGFYESLADFVKQYFNKATRKLRMSDLISSMSYHYRLADSDEMETKSQSGGTTSTITAFVISVLLKRLTSPYVQMHMPIILDEISVLDGKNTESTIKQIAEHGFSLFCATPSFSAPLSSKVRRWITIDSYNVSQPLVRNCHKYILPEHIESWGEH